jgi:hypothetical protein
MTVFLIALQKLAIVVGFAAFFAALFMYEDEEGKWQNRVEELWIAIDDRARITGRKAVALLNKMSDIVTAGLDRVFGQLLLSFRSIGASTSYSLATSCVIGVLNDLVIHESLKNSVGFLYGTCVLIFFAIFPTILKSRWIMPISLIPISFLIIFGFADWWFLKKWRAAPIVLGSLAISFIFDIVLIIAVRATIRRMAVGNKGWQLVVGMLLQCVCAVVVVVLPFGMAHLLIIIDTENMQERNAVVAALYERGSAIQLALLLSALSNVFTACVCLTLFFALAGVLLHRVFWPLAARAIYPLQRYEIFRNKKFLAFAGVACFVYGFQLQDPIIRMFLQFVPK